MVSLVQQGVLLEEDWKLSRGSERSALSIGRLGGVSRCTASYVWNTSVAVSRGSGGCSISSESMFVIKNVPFRCLVVSMSNLTFFLSMVSCWWVIVEESMEQFLNRWSWNGTRYIVQHIELPSIVYVGCTGRARDCNFWASGQFWWFYMGANHLGLSCTKCLGLCAGLEQPLLFSHCHELSSTVFVADEWYTDFVEICGSWILPGRDVWSCWSVVQDLCGTPRGFSFV